jgi:hypothetical protein
VFKRSRVEGDKRISPETQTERQEVLRPDGFVQFIACIPQIAPSQSIYLFLLAGSADGSLDSPTATRTPSNDEGR